MFRFRGLGLKFRLFQGGLHDSVEGRGFRGWCFEFW